MGIAPETDVARAAEHAFVGGEPAKTHFRGDFERLIRDRALRRPKPGRRLAESLLVKAAGARELLASIFGITKRRLRQRRVRDSRRGQYRNRRPAAESDGRKAWWKFRSGRARRRCDIPAGRWPAIRSAWLRSGRLLLFGEVLPFRRESWKSTGSRVKYSSSIHANCESTCRSRQSPELK